MRGRGETLRYTFHAGVFVDFVGGDTGALRGALGFLGGVFSEVAWPPVEPFVRLRRGTLSRSLVCELGALSPGTWVFCLGSGDVEAFTSDGLARLERNRGSVSVTPSAFGRYHLSGALGAGISYVLGARGCFFVHAACFLLGKVCALVIADSGAGKSALCAGALAASGRLISDDMVIVTAAAPDSHLIYAGRPDAYFSDAACRLLPRFYAGVLAEQGPARKGKQALARAVAPEAFISNATPTHMLILDRAHPPSRVTVEPVCQAEALAALVAASVRLARSALTASLPSSETALRLASVVPAYRLQCPQTLLTRPVEVMHQLLRQLESAASQ